MKVVNKNEMMMQMNTNHDNTSGDAETNPEVANGPVQPYNTANSRAAQNKTKREEVQRQYKTLEDYNSALAQLDIVTLLNWCQQRNLVFDPIQTTVRPPIPKCPSSN
jgi:NAD-specific glutamate dehydrogenase